MAETIHALGGELCYGLGIKPILRCGVSAYRFWHCAVDRVACLEVSAADIRFGRIKPCAGLFCYCGLKSRLQKRIGYIYIY